MRLHKVFFKTLKIILVLFWFPKFFLQWFWNKIKQVSPPKRKVPEFAQLKTFIVVVVKLAKDPFILKKKKLAWNPV